MLILCQLLATSLCCTLTLSNLAQPASWKTLYHGKMSLSSPPTWHLTQNEKDRQTRITLTPDSMQHLDMRMLVIFELPVNGEHNYTFFKSNFKTVVQSGIGPQAKFLKTCLR